MSMPISARKTGTHIMHCTGPDVCLTPVGSSVVPVPYMSMVTLAASTRVSRSVRNNSDEDFQLNSRAFGVTGHEPGVKKGVKVSGYKAYALAKTASSTVFSEGWAAVRDADPCWINRPDEGAVEPRRSKSTKSQDHA